MAFPSMTEIESFRTIGDIAAFIPLQGDGADNTTANGAIYELLGCSDTTPPRVLGMESEADFQAEVDACRLDPTGSTPTKPNLASRGAPDGVDGDDSARPTAPRADGAATTIRHSRPGSRTEDGCPGPFGGVAGTGDVT